ncbi:MAG: hypothetical protein LBF26_01420 [Puniceicoccales bacterium]|jgi:hypothetical protein|nr:hypothetical protein [Puniceicoccales bacterium]
MVDRLPHSVPVVLPGSAQAQSKVEVKGFFDAIVKLVTGQITLAEFRECKISLNITFDRSNIKGELIPLLQDVRGMSQEIVHEVLNAKNADGTSVAMAAATTEEGAAAVLELAQGLSVDQRREILTTNCNDQALYAEVAARTGSKDDDVDAAGRQLYDFCGVTISPEKVIDTLTQRRGHEELHGYGVGPLVSDKREENNVIAVAKMLAEIKYVPGKALTSEQANMFHAWLDGPHENMNAFLSTLSGGKFIREYVGAFCDALYNIDAGATLGEILSASRMEEGSYGPGFPEIITLGYYAKIECFPDATCAKLNAMYERCHLDTALSTINTAPGTGVPLPSGAQRRLDACTSVTIGNSRTVAGASLAITGEGVYSRHALYNMRQIGRLKNVENISFDAGTDGITGDDLFHMCAECKKLKKITLTGTEQRNARITEATIQNALARAGRTDVTVEIR